MEDARRPSLNICRLADCHWHFPMFLLYVLLSLRVLVVVYCFLVQSALDKLIL
jgi:hypothetical protein